MGSLLDGRQELEFDGIGRAIERGDTLPGRWYTDPQIAALEEERIFGRSWQYVGLAAQIPRPGDYLTHRVGRSSVLVVRGELGEIGAFANVCRHRGAELLDGCGHARSLRCPYHGWAYGLDGSLRSVPRARRNPGFDREGLSLHRLRCGTLGPLIFVNPDPEAAPLEETFAGWLERLEAGGIRFAPTLTLVAVHEHVVEANWKLICENTYECYHCPVNHPELAAVRDVRPDFWYEFHERHSVHALPDETATADVGPGQLALGSHLWPNVFPVIRDGGSIVVLQALPLDAERSIYRREFWFAQDAAPETVASMIEFIDLTDAEDIALLAGVQRGQRHPHYDRGRLLLPKTEPAIQFHQRMVYRAVAGLDRDA